MNEWSHRCRLSPSVLSFRSLWFNILRFWGSASETFCLSLPDTTEGSRFLFVALRTTTRLDLFTCNSGTSQTTADVSAIPSDRGRLGEEPKACWYHQRWMRSFNNSVYHHKSTGSDVSHLKHTCSLSTRWTKVKLNDDQNLGSEAVIRLIAVNKKRKVSAANMSKKERCVWKVLHLWSGRDVSTHTALIRFIVRCEDRSEVMVWVDVSSS